MDTDNRDTVERQPNPAPMLTIDVVCDPHVNYAMYQNDVPVVKQLSLRNAAEEPVDDLVVRAWLADDLSHRWEARLVSLPANSTYNFSTVDLMLNGGVLARQTERQRTELHIQVSQAGTLLAQRVVPLDVLAFSEWPGTGSLPELTAAFILPNHPTVQTILATARQHLERATGQPAFSGYQSNSIAHVEAMVEAIYQAIAGMDLGYINPPASFERQGQKVRLPDEIATHRLATCLDLTLLMAACFEQAGLNPLIVLVDGHAFVALWANAQTFAEPVVDDALRIRKRMQLGEIIAVETTVLTNRPVPSIADARRAALRHMEDVDRFICAIDVRAARSLSIRPLPVRVVEGQVVLVDDGPTMVATRGAMTEAVSGADAATNTVETVPSAQDTSQQAEPPETPAARLERWKRRLLDLSLRNRVLNYREANKAIPLMCPDVARLEDQLALGQRFTILPRPKLMQEDQPRSAEIHLARTGEDPIEKLLREDMEQRRLHANLTPQELERRSLEIYRAARASMEESGVSTLYLAIGFLTWYESPSSQTPRRAPILLVPVELERVTARSQFTLRLGDEDPRINVTLLEKLKTDFGLEKPGLDELAADESGVDVPLILRRFRELIKDEPRWDVVEEAHLGLFSFTKFLMWRDLQDRAATLMKNKVVRYLVERPAEPFGDPATFPRVEELDATRSPAESFCPRDADSSQLAAIYAAHDGHSFVLQGPPGTGKSQTITNLIAHCLMHNKRVLFVSEKMAALNVVHRRLAECGLEPFCLELHSHKANKRLVLAQLEAALQVVQQQPPAQWQRHAEELAAARAELNALVDALHRPRALGMSVYQATGRLIALRNAARLPIRRDDPGNLNAETFHAACELADRLAAAANAVGSVLHHPLRAIRRHEWQTALPDDCLRAVNAADDGLQILHDRLEAFVQALALSGDFSLATLDWLTRFAALLLEPTRASEVLLTEQQWPAVRDTLNGLIRQGKERDERWGRLATHYQPEVLQENLVFLRGNLQASLKKWAVPRWLGTRAVRKQLAVFYQGDGLPSGEVLLQELDELLHVKRASEALADPSCLGRHYFGAAWRDGKADWAALETVIDWCDRFHELIAAAPQQLRENDQLVHLVDLVVNQRDRITSDAQKLRGYIDAHAALQQRLSELAKLVDADDELAWGASDAPAALPRIAATLADWRENVHQLNDWCYWRRVRNEVIAADLQPLVASYERGELLPSEFRPAVEHSLLRLWFNATCDAEEPLRLFNSTDHQNRIERFRQLDREHLNLTRQMIVARLAANVPQVFGEPSANSEMGILKRQLSLQRRQMPVRKLLEKLPHLLPRLKPCVLMSPLSVAQYLDADFPPFDLVVFDEASQIPVWDAVGAIARGEEVIVVGDSKQLPPTNFFMKMSDEAVEDEDDFEELESVLDECVASQIPSMRLQWHYRSKHESLIAFSNYHYYDNTLYTFPSPVAESERLGVSLRYVPEGVYDRGRSRTNRAEAEAVVEEVVRRLREPGDDQSKSIGIVTFSLAQQELIENLLDEARRKYPEIEPWFSDDQLEPVFVKNLENVQGDERAVIFFSICYGRDQTGRLPMTFGPINRDGGERRLNVAITRAREQVIVFSSIRAEDIDLSRTGSVGVKHLRSFLDYAERGPAAIAEAITLDPNASFDSPFEQDVCEALEARGWRVDRQVGCSGYRIDLAVRDPDRPGAYLLGIECDGAFYHSGRTARDRDRLRQSVLESLGWKLHRIWSRDWWLNPQGVLAKLDEALGAAKRQTQPLVASAAPAALVSPPVSEPQTQDETESESTTSRSRRSDAAQPQPVPPGLFLYKAFTSRRLVGDVDAFYNPARGQRLAKLILDILEVEAPMSIALLARRVIPMWGISRRTSRVDERLSEVLAELANAGRVMLLDRFIWLAEQDPANYAGFRVPANADDRPRDLEDIPPQELANACLTVLRQQISLPVEDLVRETARLLGFARLPNRATEHIEPAIDLLRQKNLCLDSDGRITLPRT